MPPCRVCMPQVEGDALAGLTLLLDLPPAQRREAEALARRLGAEVGSRTGQVCQLLQAFQDSLGHVLLRFGVRVWGSDPHNTFALPACMPSTLEVHRFPAAFLQVPFQSWAPGVTHVVAAPASWQARSHAAAGRDVVSPTWLEACGEGKRLVPLRPRDYCHMRGDTAAAAVAAWFDDRHATTKLCTSAVGCMVLVEVLCSAARQQSLPADHDAASG